MDYNKLVKVARSNVIKAYLKSIGTNKCVCFSCGNAVEHLRKVGINVIGVGEKSDLIPAKWFTFNKIANTFNLFDATCGHLPVPLMVEISKILKKEIKTMPKSIELPTGSGETLVCLKMAFPNTTIIPVYNTSKGTEYNENAPLNSLVNILNG